MEFRICIRTHKHAADILSTDFQAALDIFNSFCVRKSWKGSNKYEVELQGSTKSTQWSTILKKK